MLPSPGAVFHVAVIAFGCSAAVALLGTVVLRALWQRSLAVAASGVVVVIVLGVGAGVLVSAKKMFLSKQDLGVALVVVTVSGLVTATCAVLAGRPTVLAARQLRAAARRLGRASYQPVPRPPTTELAGLAAELDATHTRLVEARERERALEASRRELVAWVSHDLRTPLAGIRAMAEALEDGVVADRVTVDRYHTQMRVDADRLASMVDDLFELSRVHAGALRLTFSRVRLHDLVTEAVTALDPVARAKGVRLWRDPPAGPAADLAVDVDPDAVGRALRNLLVNAIRHTPSDGTVQVLVGGVHSMPAYSVDGPVDSVDGVVDNNVDGWRPPVDAAALIAVQDTCGGIPAHDLPRIFEVGYRGEAARTPACTGHSAAPGQGIVGVGGTPGIVAGAGLGLTIARGIVEAHRGRVSVANVAAGCRFVVQLPLVQVGVGVDAADGGPVDDWDAAPGGGMLAAAGRDAGVRAAGLDGPGRSSGRRAGRGSGGRHEVRGRRRAGRRRP